MSKRRPYFNRSRLFFFAPLEQFNLVGIIKTMKYQGLRNLSEGIGVKTTKETSFSVTVLLLSY